MGKLLLLLRHGKSDWNNETESDFERPLARRGIKAAQRMGLHLAAADYAPEVIYTSPARRALRTAELVQEELGDTDLLEDDAIYEATLERMVQFVQALPADLEIVMIVGHNPTLEELSDELTGRSDTVMKTCTLAVLSCKADSWADSGAGDFELVELLHPAEVDE